MVGVGVEPSALAAARRLRPGRASAKRSWPPGCGRPPPAPPPAPPLAAAAGDGEKGADGSASGRAGEAIAAVSPLAQNGSLFQHQDSHKVDAAVAAVSPLAPNGSLLQHQDSDKVEAAVAAVSPLAQNGSLLQHQDSDKVEAAVAAVSPLAQNGSLLQHQDSDKVEAAVAAVSPLAQNVSLLQHQGSDKVEAAVAPVSPLAPNGSLLQPQGSDKVEVAVSAISPPAQNGSLLQHQGSDKGEEAIAPAVSPVAQNGALPQQQGTDKVKAAAVPTAVSPVAQNGDLSQQEGSHKVEELVPPAAVSSAECNGSLSHAPPQLGHEKAGEDGDKRDNREAQLLGDAGVPTLDDQVGNMVMDVAAPAVKVQESCGIVTAASSVQNGGEGAGLSAAKEQGGGGSGDVGREVAADRDAMEMGNRTGGSGLEGKENEVAGRRIKRWLTSALNPPPKMRAVSAVRRFPPGCGRTAVTAEGTTEASGVLDVPPVRAFPPGCGGAAVTTTESGVLEVSPIRTFPPDWMGSGVTDRGNEEVLPLKATTVTSGDAVVAVPVLGGAASSTIALEASSEKLEGKIMVDEGHNLAHNRVQVPDDFVGNKQDGNLHQNIVAKAILTGSSNEKTKGKLSAHEGKPAGQTVDDKMKNKLEGSLHRSTLRTPLSGPIDAKAKGKRSESDKMNAALLCNAKASVAGKMQSKTLSTKKELVCSYVNLNQNKSARKLKGDGISKDNLQRSARESKFGKQVVTNKIEESDGTNLVPEQVIVQALMAPDKCPWSRGRKSIASASKSLPRRNKLKGNNATPIKLLTGKVASRESINDETMEDNDNSSNATPIKLLTGKVASRESINDETMEDNDNSNMEDDNSKALVVYEEKREICVTVPPSVPTESHHTQSGDARSRVRKLLQLFQAICRKLMQVEEQGNRNVGRVDLEAMKALKKDPIYKKLGPIVGNIPGVEVGDEFHFRVELSIVSLHRPNQAGIDTAKVNGVPVAVSIVASGGYPDELSSSDELIYTGSGGKAGGNKEADDQKLERGNLALKNCIETKTPVRVIHGFKGQSNSKVVQSRGKQTSTFIYDGLYEVVECWKEGPKGEMVFKYKLRRLAGQPELALHAVQATRKSKVREGLCLPDISQGSERIPICVINTIDDMRPAPFKYITQVIYPPWYEKEPPAGCNCTNGCSDSTRCACVVKNGGEIPFNFNGAIVEARPLIYECGPSCRCPPTCHNRVSQHGIKIPLEIFKTGRTGWGVRSLSSISSGSFICEYTGELLEDKEAEKTHNDEYLFDIGNNYHDKELWEGLKSVVGVQSSTSSSKTMEGFTINAAECGNVGRFINHSCSPNLYAQNVLWDHDDMRMPHVMFFALENIPPLQELTYHYNYEVGQVHDKNGKEKVKHCYCGTSDCSGRLY
ncbi:unnamed protein product [Urochloa humidicola]